jgi:hypothetical protein
MNGNIRTPAGELVLSRIRVILMRNPETDNSIDRWSGSFRTRRIHEIPAGEYLLEFPSGALGDIMVSINGRNCTFIGNGPLRRP